MLNLKRLAAIVFILICVSLAWMVLAAALAIRTEDRTYTSEEAVDDLWGPPLRQRHPTVSYPSPTTPGGRKYVQPVQSDISVVLKYSPKRKGLLWHRTFQAAVDAIYQIRNTTLVSQTFYIQFPLPAHTSYSDFVFEIDGKSMEIEPRKDGVVVGAVQLGAGAQSAVKIAYRTQGKDRWEYLFDGTPRVEQFNLAMRTDFDEIDFPVGTASPTGDRVKLNPGWELNWSYPKWLAPPGIGMEMPSVVNPGPVASRITFFAPISLLFFFTVLILMSTLLSVPLHPMHFFFLGAACFAFQLLFAYSVDLLPALAAFCIAATVSLALNLCYLGAVTGWKFARLAVLAQFGYLVLFSYSFFFEGLTGITITVGGIVTLAIMMIATARVSWDRLLAKPVAIQPAVPAL